jgi:hypothetical protein
MAGAPNVDQLVANSKKEFEQMKPRQSGSSVTLAWKSEGESILLSVELLAGLMRPGVQKVRVRP